MKQQNLKQFAVSCGMLGLLLSACPSLAQGKLRGLTRVNSKEPHADAASHSANTPEPLTSYTFGFVDYPLASDTAVYGINPGATNSKMEAVGAYGPEVAVTGAGSGFFLQVVQNKANFTETFKSENFPKSTYDLPAGINDSGQIVGTYWDLPNTVLGYELSGGKYTKLEVPFSGATYTLPSEINNSGEIVGTWADSSLVDHGFLLSGGVYTSFDYPGAAETDGIGINAAGVISGFYYDTSGIYHGFLLNGGTYTSIDVPGAVGTIAYGNNDAEDVVGFYCMTTECLTNYSVSGAQGFLLSGGIYTTINVPGFNSTVATDINDNGVIVGYDSDNAGNNHAFFAIP